MPQMAPLNWLSLMMMFIAILILFNSVNYFSFLYKPKTNFITKSTLNTSWKW